VNANKTPYLRRTEARKGRENSSAKRDSLLRPEERVLTASLLYKCAAFLNSPVRNFDISETVAVIFTKSPTEFATCGFDHIISKFQDDRMSK